MIRTARRPILVAAAAVVVLAVGGCTGGSSEDPSPSASTSSPPPAEVLADAQQVLDAAASFHLELTGEDLPAEGTVVLGADGDAERPASFGGDLRAQLVGVAVTVGIISIDGSVWAKLPLTTGYVPVNPSLIGISDPAELIKPGTGLSSLLTAGTNPEAAGEVRLGTEVLDEYTTTLRSSDLDGLLPVTDPTAVVQARFAIDPDSSEVRRAVLTGPFYAGGEQTYTALLTDYGVDVDIRAP